MLEKSNYLIISEGNNLRPRWPNPRPVGRITPTQAAPRSSGALADRDVVLESPGPPRHPWDQIFIAAFIKSHGSIKEMETFFGVSYPTIKARLNRIAGALQFIDTDPAPPRSEILERLSRGEIIAADAINELEGKS